MEDGCSRSRWLHTSRIEAAVISASPNATKIVTPDEINPYMLLKKASASREKIDLKQLKGLFRKKKKPVKTKHGKK